MRRTAPLFLPFALFVLASCAGESGWSNPNLPKASWSSDLGDCREEAEDSLGPSAYIPPGEERTGNPMTLVDRTDNARRFDAMVAMCMQAKGYRRTR